MNIEIVSFEFKPTRYEVGKLVVRYHDMLMHMDLVIYQPQKKLWLRMPERWIGDKRQYCYWPNQDMSDNFQKGLLKLLHDKYDVTFETASEKALKKKLAVKAHKKAVHETKK